MQEQNLLWSWFIIFTLTLLIGDYYYTKKNINSNFSLKKIINLNILWIGFALLFLIVSIFISYIFNDFTFTVQNKEFSLLWLTGFIVEKSLAMDNVFVFLIIFAAFSIKGESQKQILFYGISAAIILRIIMIFLAAKIIKEFEFLLVFFGFILLYLGYKSWPKNNSDEDYKEPNWIIWIKNHINIKNTKGYIIKDKNEKYGFYITNSFLCLLSIGFIDLIFAVDSIPAIFAITTNEFIVVTSNVLAVLGMAPLFFLLQEIKDKFFYLSHALSIILVFIGIKLLILSFFKIPTLLSLFFILGTLIVAIILSYYKNKLKK